MANNSKPFVVKGEIQQQDGNPAASLNVKAFDADIHGEQLLGETTTDEGGAYQIKYTAEQFSHGDMDRADLIVRVYDLKGNELGASEVKFNTPAKATINLVVELHPESDLSEYEQLLAEITPILEGVPLADLTDHDFVFLNGKTGIARDRLEYLRHAAQLSRQTDLPSEVFYAFARNDLPPDLKALLSLDIDTLRGVLETAIKRRMIPASILSSLPEIMSRLEKMKSANTTVSELAAVTGVELPTALSSYLDKRGIRTLADIRASGGIADLEGLPISVDHAVVRLIEAQAALGILPLGLAERNSLIEKGFTNVFAIADVGRAAFLDSIHEQLGDLQAARLKTSAEAQAGLMYNWLVSQRIELDGSTIGKVVSLKCSCEQCISTLSPAAYLADLLYLAVRRLQYNSRAVTPHRLESLFHQPFGQLAQMCDSDEQVLQVRLCIQVLQRHIQPGLAANPQRAALISAWATYRFAAYTMLLAKIGTSWEELLLARNSTALKAAVAQRVGIEAAHINALYLNPQAVARSPKALTEAALEMLFGLKNTEGISLHVKKPPKLLTWQLEYLSTLWYQQDHEASPFPEGYPVVEPDLIGPDDLRLPEPKKNTTDPDSAFDVWIRRREWVDGRLQALKTMTHTVRHEVVPDLGTMLGSMYQPVTYVAWSTTPWSNSTPQGELVGLNDKLVSGVDVIASQQRIEADLQLTQEAFDRLMALAGKHALWVADQRQEVVTDEEWHEVYSILVQAQKRRLFPYWLVEEQQLGIVLNPETFWISQRAPAQGEWPPVRKSGRPLIDPVDVSLLDLPEEVVGAEAISVWQNRAEWIRTQREQLKVTREASSVGFRDMLTKAFSWWPVPPPAMTVREGLQALQQDLASDSRRQAAERTIVDILHLSLEAFLRLMDIEAKERKGQLPSALEFEEVYSLLSDALRRHKWQTWSAWELDPSNGLNYWQLLKARLPKWRASSQVRAKWQEALKALRRQVIVDPDLIGPTDIKTLSLNRPDQPAYKLWVDRDALVQQHRTALDQLRQQASNDRNALNGLLSRDVGLGLIDLLALDGRQRNGEDVAARLDQLDLTPQAFNYLMRAGRLAATTPHAVQPLEWDAIEDILTGVWKRRVMLALWHNEEAAKKLTLSPDHFQIWPIEASVSIPSTSTTLPTWRASQQDRLQWEAKLQTRLEQKQTLEAALTTALAETEELTLPALRDAFINASEFSGNDLPAKADAVAANLLIETRGDGCAKTTRISQAIETLQTLFFCLRSGQLPSSVGFTLNADRFDQDWQWIGSYAAWRAALLVFLYPENHLTPSSRQDRTPAFHDLMVALRANRHLNSADTQQAAEDFLTYYRDVCSLKAGATCWARSRLKGETTERDLTYMFALAEATGQVYWSICDPDGTLSGEVKYWRVIPGLNDIAQILGAVRYQVSPGKQYICLFAVQGMNQEKLIVAKLGLDTHQWTTAELELQPGAKASNVVVKQYDDDNQPLHLAIRLVSGAVFERFMNNSASGWAGDWKVIVNPKIGSEIIDALVAMLAISKDEYVLLGIKWYRSDFGAFPSLLYRLCSTNWVSAKDNLKWQELSHGTFCGSFAWPMTRSDPSGAPGAPPIHDIAVYYNDAGDIRVRLIKPTENEYQTINTVDGFNGWLLWVFGLNLKDCTLQLGSGSGSRVVTLYDYYYYHNSPGNRGDAQVIRDFAAKWQTEPSLQEWKLAEEIYNRARVGYTFEDLLVQQLRTGECSVPGRKAGELGNIFAGPTGLRQIWTAAGAQNAPMRVCLYTTAGVFTTVLDRALDEMTERQPAGRIVPIIPSAQPGTADPLSIPAKLSSTEAQARSTVLAKLFQLNGDALHSTLTYLEEAYYFVPMLIGLALSNQAYYLSALDWFRTVYDYLATPGRRKIYPGLVLEESLSVDVSWSINWLLDPLDPHALARLRRNAYSRFTLFTLIQCLLDYADSEFAADTAESLPRAKTLYQTALALLQFDELKAVDPCQAIEPGVVLPAVELQKVPRKYWAQLHEFQRQLRELTELEVSRRKEIEAKVKAILQSDVDLPALVADAWAAIEEARATLPPPPTTEEIMSYKRDIREQATLTLLKVPQFNQALDQVGRLAARAFESWVSAVTSRSLEVLALEPQAWLRQPTAELVQPAGNGSRTRTYTLDDTGPGSMTATARGVSPSEWIGAMEVVGPGYEILSGTLTPLCLPPNPLLQTWRLRAEVNLHKIRTCCNMAGLKREVETLAAVADGISRISFTGTAGQLISSAFRPLAPTPYRYPVLIERAKQLVTQAQQIESSLLGVLQQRDVDAYNLLQAQQNAQLSFARVQLQNLLVAEAQSSMGVSQLQYNRVQMEIDHYQQLLDKGVSASEEAQLSDMGINMLFEFLASEANLATQNYGGGISSFGQEFSISASKAGLYASYERRQQDWELRSGQAQQEARIASQQIGVAYDYVQVARQERTIGELQSEQATTVVDFLVNKFMNVAMYDWMIRMLTGVFSYFLQQATSVAQLAANQLAFERQEPMPVFIQADYWLPPSEDGTSTVGDNSAPDRSGLTGSARLLRDIYQLDQYAFETNKRKLQLTKTISLAQLAPIEFQRFRETGVLDFATPMELFDCDFPGHYLRLIRRVRVSIVALIPPSMGIRATLTSSRISRVVLGPPGFPSVQVHSGPDLVALTATQEATGLFELDPQSDMLAPFEGIGVDTTWEFLMPKAANFFDYNTIADVILKIDYTALNNLYYGQQVNERLPRTRSADRPYSFRLQFADAWYDLHNPELTTLPMTIHFQTMHQDFPPNLEDLRIQQVVLYFARKNGSTFEIPVTSLRFSEDGVGSVGGSATSVTGVISTRRGNGSSWVPMIGKSPFGEWVLVLPNTEELKNRFKNEEIEDILFVITFSGNTPEWPA